MTKQHYTITEKLDGSEKIIGSAVLENLEQAKGFAEALRGYLMSEIKIANDMGEVLASKVFNWV
jgi:hypothetical protein